MTLYFCSWSGGKDSALALYRAQRTIGPPGALLTVMTEDGQRSRSHGLHRDVLDAQAQSIGVQIRFVSAAWSQYERRFGDELADLASAGFSHGVYGDIDVQSHKDWVDHISSRNNITAVEPLWQAERHELLADLLQLGFEARIVAIKVDVLPANLLGRDLSWEVIETIEALGCDPSGEGGEYHTVTFNGPIFSRPLFLEDVGYVERDGYRFQDVKVRLVRRDSLDHEPLADNRDLRPDESGPSSIEPS